MSQSTTIVATLFVGFFVYITLKGELPTYAGLLLLSPAQSGTTKTSENNTDKTQQTASMIIQGAEILAAV